MVGKETPNLNQKSLGFLAPGAPRSGECPSESEDRDSLGLQRVDSRQTRQTSMVILFNRAGKFKMCHSLMFTSLKQT